MKYWNIKNNANAHCSHEHAMTQSLCLKTKIVASLLLSYRNAKDGCTFNTRLLIKHILPLCLMLFYIGNLQAQYNTYSPFSRYGIGDIQDQASAYQKGMNNTGIALPIDTTAPLFVNLLNPASLATLKLTVIEGSGQYLHTNIANPQNYKVQYKSTNFNSLLIAFPIKKHSGLAFGLLPYSFVGYNIHQTSTISNIGDVNYVYEGSGGLNKVFMGYGFTLSKYFKKPDSTYKPLKELIKNVCIGINANYIFGELAQTATVNYPSTSTYYNFVNDKRTRVNGVSMNAGIQSSLLLNKQTNSAINFGFTFSYPSLLKTHDDHFSYNFLYNYFGEKYIIDTLYYHEDQLGKMKLPSVYGGGISYVVSNQWGIGVDVKYTNWKTFYSSNTANSLSNALEVNIGGYVQPDRFVTGKGNYWKKVIYRAGAGYTNGYQEYQGTSIPAYSFSAGCTLPVGLYRVFSSVHIAAQYILKGNEKFILRENIFKLNIGITLNDRWFIKYKYD